MRTKWPPVIARAGQIADEYRQRIGAPLTLRQLFYRLVAEQLIGNRQSQYQRLAMLTAEGRRAGTFPGLADHTRGVNTFASWSSPKDAVSWLADRYRVDRTAGQPVTVVLGVEKRGMVEQLEAWFGDLGVPVTAAAGYASQALCDQVTTFVSRRVRPAVLLYAGDYDPTGADILRDLVARTGPWKHVEHVALTADQVEQYGLPPAPGKASDPRAAGFVARHGELVQVELDALAPDDLRDLYDAALGEWWDAVAYRRASDRESEHRVALQVAAERLPESD